MSSFSTIRTQPIIRPTYMEVGEVPRPHIDTTAIIRCDLYTLLRVHPGADTPRVIQEIGANLDSDGELTGWITPFTDCAVDLRALHRDPLGYLISLDPTLTRIPCLAPNVPEVIRAPWANYT